MSTVQTIRGWMLEDERLALRRWSFGKTVLEMGAFEGLSTLNIAATAKGVVTVDTFDGRGTLEEGCNTEEILWNNLQNAADRVAPVQVHKGTFAEVLPRLDRKFDRIFIDGSHDYESVIEDINLAEPLLELGGALIFHDYDTKHPGVVKAVDELVESGGVPVAQEETLIMVKVEYKDPEPRPVKLAIGLPHRDGWALYGSTLAATKFPTQRYDFTVIPRGNSILTMTFNDIFAEALNLRDREGVTHFAMLHNDIVPANYWVDILIDEMEAHRLDCISCVVPIKNQRGLTSTAADTLGNPWGQRRLTMHEVMQLPETFKAKDIPYRQPDSCLLLNSGCWLMKLNEPWVNGLWFRQQDKISWMTVHGEWGAMSIGEDWDFSRQLYARGCRLGATRKVPLYHDVHHFNNQTAWGEWTQDEDFLKADKETREYKEQHEKELIPA